MPDLGTLESRADGAVNRDGRRQNHLATFGALHARTAGGQCASGRRFPAQAPAVRDCLPARVLLGSLRRELEAHECLAADDLRVVTRLDHIRLTGREFDNCSILVRHAHPS